LNDEISNHSSDSCFTNNSEPLDKLSLQIEDLRIKMSTNISDEDVSQTTASIFISLENISQKIIECREPYLNDSERLINRLDEYIDHMTDFARNTSLFDGCNCSCGDFYNRSIDLLSNFINLHDGFNNNSIPYDESVNETWTLSNKVDEITDEWNICIENSKNYSLKSEKFLTHFFQLTTLRQ
jgi:hypothetical protein